MTPSKLPLALSVLAIAFFSVGASASAWAPAGSATVHPGVLTFTGGRADDEPQRLEVASILHDVAGFTAPRWRDAAQAEGRPIELRVKAQPGLFIFGRAAALREALANLLFNAVDALPAGGTITLAALQDGEHVVVTVTDSGIGMSAETKARIFEPFFSTKWRIS